MQQLTFGECVKRTWASALEAATRMPQLMLGAFVVFAALAYVTFAGRPLHGGSEMPSDSLVLAGKIASLLHSLVYLGFTVKIQRFVLLREGPEPLVPLGGKPLARLFGLGIVIVLVVSLSAILLALVLRPHYRGGIVFITMAVVIIWIFIGVRLSLLFPAIATGSRIELRSAWHDSSGHFWSLVGVQFVAALPLVACTAAVVIVFRLTGFTLADFTSPAWLLLLAITQSVGNVAYTLVTSSSLAWLYRRYANRLPAPPEG
jgi:hypothetical protein